jgi:hypothetical protein
MLATIVRSLHYPSQVPEAITKRYIARAEMPVMFSISEPIWTHCQQNGHVTSLPLLPARFWGFRFLPSLLLDTAVAISGLEWH